MMNSSAFRFETFLSNRSFALLAVSWLVISANVLATAASASQLTLSWMDNSNDEDGFKIERAIACGTFTQIATVGANVTNYTDTGLAPLTLYCYRVRAYNANGDSDYSNVGSATIPAPDTAPTVPSGLTTSASTATQITLSWNASTDIGGTGLAGYKVYRDDTLVATTTVTSYSDSGLSPATEYCYTVTAYDNAGNNSTASAQACITTQATDTTPPSVPNGVSASAISPTQVTLTWSASPDSDLAFFPYRIYRNGTFIRVTKATSFSDSGLSAGTQYCYTIVAYDNAGNSSSASAQACTTTQTADTTPPSVPSGVSASAVSPTQIALTWNASTDSNLAVFPYRIYRNGTLIRATRATSYSDSGLSAGTQYCYTIVAYDNAGNSSSASAPACVTTLSAAVIVNAPSNLAASAVAADKINLSWQDNANNEAGFAIERYQLSTGWIQITTVGANTTSFSDVGLSPSTSYSYRVYAFNDPNYSPVSASASATTLPAAPVSGGMAADEFVGPFNSWADLQDDYGAVGNGVADDTAALGSAVLFDGFLQPAQRILGTQGSVGTQDIVLAGVFVQNPQHPQRTAAYSRIGNEVPSPNMTAMRDLDWPPGRDDAPGGGHDPTHPQAKPPVRFLEG